MLSSVTPPVGHCAHRVTKTYFSPVTLVDDTRGRMLYQAYQAQADIMTSLRGVAGVALQGFGQLHDLNPWLADCGAVRRVEAGYELLERVGLTHERPPWGIDTVKIGRREVTVDEEATDVLPFGT